MKKHLLLTLSAILLIAISVSAQDIIVKKSGDEIQSKVVEISSKEIKYKKFSNLEGPTYTMSKDEIFMLKYENGEKEVFDSSTNTNNKELSIGLGQYYLGDKQLSKPEFIDLIKTNDRAYKEYKSFKFGFITSIILAVPGGALIGYGLVDESDLQGAFLGTGAICIGGSLVIALLSDYHRKNAMKIFNTGKNTSFQFNYYGNGIGLAYNF